MYLIKGEDTLILVDTGGSDEKWAKKYHHPINQSEEMKPVNALKKFDVKPEDINIIINTHLHWDHCFNNDIFKNAKIYVQRDEIRFAISPIPTQYSYYESYQIGMTPKWIESMNRFVTVDGDYNIKEGIDLITLPGHTPGFQGVLVNTTKGKYLIAGDCVGLMENWEIGTMGEPTPSGIHVSLEDYYESFKKMKRLCDYVLPGHDEKVFEHEVYPFE